jgi:hypothetical protein
MDGQALFREDTMRFRLAAAALCVAACATISCGGIVDPSKNRTETFTGTLEPYPSANSVAVFPFSTSKSGEYSVKITALAPNTNVFLTTTYGVSQSGACGPIQQNPFSALNSTSLSGAITPGTWCVAIQDLGALTANETFTMTVSHP